MAARFLSSVVSDPPPHRLTRSYLVKRQKKRMQEKYTADAEEAELNAARVGPAKQRSYSAATSNSGTGAGSSEYSSRSGSGSYDEEDELI